MLSVAEAREQILSKLLPTAVETVGLSQALGRVLAEDVISRVRQPPVDMSAMDGYAVRAEDLCNPPVNLKLVGEAPAGGAYLGRVGPGEAVRIFTGAPLPTGANAIVIQEDVAANGTRIEINTNVSAGNFIRPAGLDFNEGDIGLSTGQLLRPYDLALAASMNVPWLKVRRKPRVAILATGNELVMPGEPIKANQIISSNNIGLAAFLESAGAQPIDLGIAFDNEQSLMALAADAADVDMLVTIGGASVGDHDLVQKVLGHAGLKISFWRIAMRPGKPLMFGKFGSAAMLGLPGNPVSALVCSLIFLRPAIAKMLGQKDTEVKMEDAEVGVKLPPNDQREDYLRATLAPGPTGSIIATPFEIQDSSMLSRLAHAQCLIVRAPNAKSMPKGSRVKIIRL